jgi:hypothetical protein
MAPTAIPDSVARSGPGALCAEAQADGVPCGDLAAPCEECVKARLVAGPCTCQVCSPPLAGALSLGTRLAAPGRHA